MKIDLFVVGAQKAGTTAMHAMLRRHPLICMAEPKELHLFDRASAPGAAHLARTLERVFGAREDTHRVLGEATPSYCFVPHAIERIRAYNPEARILMLLRQPAFRAFSHWRMERARGREPLAFEEAIGAEARARTHSCDRALRTYSYIERGYFAPQAERLLQHFGSERCCFLRTDAFWSGAQATLDRVTSFLGLPAASAGDVRMLRPVAVDRSLQIAPCVRERLDALYRDDILRTEQVTGVALADWLAPDYAEPMRS